MLVRIENANPRPELTAEDAKRVSALRWVFVRYGKTITIPGARKTSQLEENLGALEFGRLAQAPLWSLVTWSVVQVQSDLSYFLTEESLCCLTFQRQQNPTT